MDVLFLKLLNMSITGTYVILAVILVRLLLARMPKRYAYWLWSVVLFRLICPVSLSSVFSIFQAKPFDMTVAQSEGTAMLRYIPENIGTMRSPEVTVGIPVMNSAISGSLPEATPFASLNPMQIWILLGTVLWTAGLILFLAYNLYTYFKLKLRMATAVRLEGNVYESDRIRSLKGSDGSTAKAYSMALVSFAANRRFLVASPLAFGETGIRERVKNVLRHRMLPRWAAIMALLVCTATVVACATNPPGLPAFNQSELYGNYRFVKPIYMNPLSSFLPMEGMKEYYTLTENIYMQVDETGQRLRAEITWKPVRWNTAAFRNTFMMAEFGGPDLTKYRNKSLYYLKDESGGSSYHLYKLDDDIWLARLNKGTDQKEYFWSIYQITPVEGTIPDKMTVSGWEDGVSAFQVLQKDYVSSYDNDTCFNITPDYIQNNSDYRIFKYNQSCATFLLHEGDIYLLGEYFGGFGVVSMAMADLNADGLQELYFTSSWGSGLHRSNAAYFEPATREIISFSYTHLNEDMMFAHNPTGGLSLHEAAITGLTDFAHFSMEKKEFLADVVVQDGKMDLL